MKIFVIGFQRGGTTLTKRVMNFHPDIQVMFHEKRVLDKDIDKYLRGEGYDPKGNWGEKIPFYTDSPEVLISHCEKFIKVVGKENSKIIYVIRHPLDIAISTYKLKWCRSMVDVLRMWESFTPKTIEYVKNLECGYIFKFEDLVTEPLETIKMIYKFCDLDHSDELVKSVISDDKTKWRHFQRIEPSRAFAYKKNDTSLYTIVDYDNII